MSAKYPRTPHLPWSPGGTSDDRRLSTVQHLLGRDLILTEKMDGSNACFTRDHFFARSHAGAPSHPSFAAAKALHPQIAPHISKGLSVFGEWCFAVHSITYKRLPAWFMVFGVRDDTTNLWWSWDEVEMMAQDLGLPTVPVLARSNVSSTKDLEAFTNQHTKITESVCGGPREGIVVRTASGYHTDVFDTHIAKWVRQNHVQTDEHWSHSAIIRQPLA